MWIGFDARQCGAYAVASSSMSRHARQCMPVRGVILENLRRDGLYHRPTRTDNEGRLWDEISDAPMSTAFAISRFLVPTLARDGWALFVDCDVLARRHLDELFKQARSDKAVMVVKHNHQPTAGVKMDGQVQTKYPRKNWSSVCLFNCDHPANKALTVEMVNSLPGRDLHRFCWLDDDQIGQLDVKWNWLAGHSDPAVDPAIVHFTDGVPTMPGYENTPFADEWFQELHGWAR